MVKIDIFQKKQAKFDLL